LPEITGKAPDSGCRPALGDSPAEAGKRVKAKEGFLDEQTPYIYRHNSRCFGPVDCGIIPVYQR
jgi:hypothetical protein